MSSARAVLFIASVACGHTLRAGGADFSLSNAEAAVADDFQQREPRVEAMQCGYWSALAEKDPSQVVADREQRPVSGEEVITLRQWLRAKAAASCDTPSKKTSVSNETQCASGRRRPRTGSECVLPREADRIDELSDGAPPAEVQLEAASARCDYWTRRDDELRSETDGIRNFVSGKIAVTCRERDDLMAQREAALLAQQQKAEAATREREAIRQEIASGRCEQSRAERIRSAAGYFAMQLETIRPDGVRSFAVDGAPIFVAQDKGAPFTIKMSYGAQVHVFVCGKPSSEGCIGI